MSLVKWAFIGVLLLPLVEIAAFIVIAFAIGWGWTICLFLATTAAGLLLLRHVGRRDLDRLRKDISRDGFTAMRLDRLGPIAGGILLVFPGFVTDLAGALLLVPAIRRWLGSRIRRARTGSNPQPPSVIDLAPEEWREHSAKSLEERPPHKLR